MNLDLSLAAALLAGLGASPATVLQSTPPAPPTVLTDVRLTDEPEAPRFAIVIEEGRIAEILGEGTPAPPGHRRIDGAGALALPAFVDAFTHTGCATPEPDADRDRPVSTEANVQIEMREAGRKGLQPAFRAVEVFELDDERLAAYRESGFAVVHSGPSGQLLAGTSTVLTVRDAAVRDRVLVSDAFQSASLRATGSGYPGTLMGRIAHLRQFFLDARWHAERKERHAAAGEGRRPPYDPDLDAVGPVLRGDRRLLCHGDDAGDVGRWLELARTLPFEPILCGGREAWKVAGELVVSNVPVILDPDCGEEVPDPDVDQEETEEGATAPEETGGGDEETAASAEEERDWIYEEPLPVQRDRRRRWEEDRDCALRLHQAGVTFAFGSVDGPPGELLDHVRSLVSAGLPEEAALAALTTTGAELLGVGAHVGRIAVGYDANIALWSASPFEKTAHLDWLVVDGTVHEFDHLPDESSTPAEGVDVTGTWDIRYEEREGLSSMLALDMASDGSVRGTLTFVKSDGEESQSEVTGRVSGRAVNLEATVELGGLSASIRFEAAIEENGMRGDATWKYSGGEETSAFDGERTPPDGSASTDGEGRESR